MSENLVELVQRFAGRRILVVGDLMLDRYVVGSVDRISPEAPVPVVRVTDEHARPGGAANVALNVQALGGQALVSGVVGADPAGRQLLSLLNEAGIDTTGVLEGGSAATTVKTRVMAGRQQIVRVDREDPPEAIEGLAAAYAERIGAVIGKADGVVIEDYGKGAVTQAVVDLVPARVDVARVPVGLDPKDNHELRVGGITVATPNYAEACGAAGLRPQPLGDSIADDPHLHRAARRLIDKWGAAFVIITLGPHGMFLLGREQPAAAIPTQAREVFDVSGAGDTVIATTLLALAAKASPYEAAAVANHAAGVVVGKIGTAACSVEELIASLRYRRE